MPRDRIINASLAFLGKKLDDIKAAIGVQRIEIGLGESSDSLEKASKALQQIAEKDLKQATESLSLTARNLSPLRGDLTRFAAQFASSAQAIQISIKNLDNREAREANTHLQQLISAVNNIKVQERDVDLSGLKDLTAILAKIEKKDNKDVIKSLNELAKAFKAFKVDFPREFSLEKRQMDQLRGSWGGTNVLTTATKVLNTTVAMTSADTQYSYTFPANTTNWRMKLRDMAIPWYYSWTTGTLKESGNASAYISLPEMWLDSRDRVEYSGVTIYFESGSATQTMEIEVGYN